LALALPGTGVLEAALARVPTVVAARPGRLDAALARRRLVAGPLSLPNRILGREVFPELLGLPTAQELAHALEHLWRRRESVRQDLDGLEQALGDPGACDRLAEHLLDKSPTT
jgi:lipid-A-disaccharide synthase